MDAAAVEWPLLQFPKITDGSQWQHVDAKLQKGSWVVVEKVHGSNFCIASNGTRTRYAKRTSWLAADDDSYFGLGDVVLRNGVSCQRRKVLLSHLMLGSPAWRRYVHA